MQWILLHKLKLASSFFSPFSFLSCALLHVPLSGYTYPDEAIWLQPGKRDGELTLEVSGLEVLHLLLWWGSRERRQLSSWRACFERSRRCSSSWMPTLIPRWQWWPPSVNSLALYWSCLGPVTHSLWLYGCFCIHAVSPLARQMWMRERSEHFWCKRRLWIREPDIGRMLALAWVSA